MQNVISLHTNNILNNSILREDAFDLTDEEKIKEIEYHFSQIMNVLGLNLRNDSLRKTPERVAKMYVKEIFSGLNPKNKPAISLFDNEYNFDKMLLEKNITLYSNCEHHFVPIIGKAHVAYFPADKVIGLSKINRLVQYYAKRPQVQERLTKQIADARREILGHNDVAVYIEADHMCLASRGVNDTKSKTTTFEYSGKFENEDIKQEFLLQIKN